MPIDYANMGYSPSTDGDTYNPNMNGSFVDASTMGSSSLALQSAAAKATYNPSDDQHWYTTLAGDVAFAPLDLVDTVASSIPFASKWAGIQRGDVNQKVLDMLDMPGLTDFYNNNRGGISAASGVLGMVAADLATGGLAGAAPVVGLLSKASWGRKALALDGAYKDAVAAANIGQESLAARGLIGSRLFTSALGEDAAALAASRGSSITAGTTITALKNTATRLGFAKGAARAAGTEAVAALTLNQNDFLFSSDASSNIMFGALGIGIGGIATTAMTKYAFRKYASSDAFRRVTAGALDPTGQMEALISAPAIPEVGSAFAKKTDKAYFGALSGGRTDKVAALMTAARSEAPAGIDGTTFNRLQLQYTQIAREETQKVVTHGVMGVEGSNFGMTTPKYGNHIDQLFHNDPGAAVGMEEIGAVAEGHGGVTGFHQARTDSIQAQQDFLDKFTKSKKFMAMDPVDQAPYFVKMKQLNFAAKLVPQPVIDGEVTTLAHAAVYDDWVEPTIKKTTQDDVHTWAAHAQDGSAHDVAISSNGDILLPGRLNVNTAKLPTTLRLARAAQQQIKSLMTPNAVMKLPEKPTWFHLDMAEALQQANPNATVLYPGGLDRDAAAVESFAQKVDAIKNKLGAAKVKKLGGGEANPGDWAELRAKFNLPRNSAYQQGLIGQSDTPYDALLRGALTTGGGNAIRKLSRQELEAGLQAYGGVTGVGARQSINSDSTMGNLMNFMTDHEGNVTAPLMTYRRPFMQADYFRDTLDERLAMKKTQTLTYMAGPRAGPMTRRIASSVGNSADTQMAAQVSTLSDAQMQSSLPFTNAMSTQSASGRVMNTVTTAEHRARDAPVVQAAARLGQSVDRMSQEEMEAAFQTHLGQALATINGPRNQTSKFLLNQFHTFGTGWDLERDLVPATLADGSSAHAFKLSDTPQNRAMFKQMHGRSMNEGETLLSPSGKQVVLDDMGAAVQQGMNGITDQLRIEKNSLLESQGMATIEYKNHYIPPPELKGKYVGYVYDVQNNIVPGGTVIANTQDAFDRMLSKFQADPKWVGNRDGHMFRTADELREFATLRDKAQMGMVNPGTTFVQGGKAGLGATLRPEVSLSAFDDSLASIRSQYLQHGRDMLGSLMDDQIQAAKARSRITGAATDGVRNPGQQGTGKNIYDYYLEALTRTSPINSDKSWIGGVYRNIAKAVDPLLEAGAVKASPVMAAANDYIRRVNPFTKGAAEQDLFNTLTAKMGPDMPFKSVGDLMEQRGFGVRPPSLQGAMSNLNRYEATWLLRMGESMQAVMNLTGVINAAPAVVRNYAMRAGETTEEHAARVGHSAQIFQTPDGAQIGVVDTAKLAWRAFQKTWQGGHDADYARWTQKGMTTQAYSEFQRAWNASETQSGMDRFLNGSPTADSKFGKRGLVGWLSWMTDASEDFSRGWAHAIGDDLGRQMGIHNEEYRDAFAHDLANKMIANYDPLNRPEMLQGAVGAPIGLFQGFIWAYYQRLFRYVETGDARALATQYATQAASFGLKTVPGFNEVNSLWFKHSDGHNDPYDSIYQRYGQPAGDLLMGGVWGNLPKLVGGKAIDLSSRGDTTFRTPTFNWPAVFASGQKMAAGIGQAANLFTQQNPHVSGEQIAEILSNSVPNRPLAGSIETFFAGGNDTDNSGQLVARSHDFMDAAARVIGVRTQTQSNELEAFYANKQAQEIQAQQKETLNRNTRELIRGNNPEELSGVFQSYVSTGGDPKYFKRWVKTTIKAATMTRGERQAIDMMHNPANQDKLDRILASQTGITAEAQQDDPSEFTQTQDTMENDMPTNTNTDSVESMYGPQ